MLSKSKVYLIVFTSILYVSKSSQVPPLMTVESLIKSKGYPFERHEIETEDGYLLGMHRIPSKGTPVLIIPGLLATSDIFNLFNESIGFQLSKSGHDIWLGNCRGNYYSRKHKVLKPDDDIFWNFSMDDMAIHDLPAMINYIVKSTKTTKINYIGYSAGSSLFFIMASEKLRELDNIKSFVALGPVYSIQRYSFFVQKDGQAYPFLLELYQELKKAKKLEGFPRKDTKRSDLQFNCSDVPEDVQQYCTMGMEQTATFFGDWLPGGSSINVPMQYLQSVSNGILTRYDYGEEINMKKYQQKDAPLVNISQMNVPTILVYSQGDEAVDETDIEADIKEIPQLFKQYKIENDDFQHGDYIHITKPSVEQDYYKMIGFLKSVIN